MQLKGQVLGYDDIATFELSDVIGSYKEDDVLYIQTSFGKTPIVYSTIEPVCQYKKQGEQEREPDRSEINDFSLRAQASEEMGCTCDACLDIIRTENEKSRPYPNRAKE